MTVASELLRADARSLGPRPLRNQRREIIRLGQCLALAEQAAERNAARLRECDHRIKNSLQIIASLIHFQVSRHKTVATRDELSAIAERIRAVASMHDALQETCGEDSVNLGAVLTTMCQSLETMGGNQHSVMMRVDVEAIHAPIAFAQPVTLLVNELVVNAMRHAFPNGRTGTIDVSMVRMKGDVCIVVADDGIGLPSSNHGHSGGYGTALVQMMTSQIGGALHIESGPGARFTLVAPTPSVAVRSVQR